jgi:hypothetical protein
MSARPGHRVGIALACVLATAVPGCASVVDIRAPAVADGPAAPASFAECQAESYDFVGDGTLAGLGLDTATPVPPPDPGRPAMIWVTHDLLPYDRGEPGGPVEMVRMLCFEFADGSGGSGWPVDPAWQPPGAAAASSQGEAPDTMPLTLLVAAVVALLVVGISVVAFRARR